jgi:hypothetical protein
MWFANIFSRSLACSFTLLTLPSTEQMFLILMKYTLPIYYFMVCAFAAMSKKLLTPWKTQWFSLIFLLSFPFKHIVYFEIKLYKVQEMGQCLFSSGWLSNCSNITCWKNYWNQNFRPFAQTPGLPHVRSCHQPYTPNLVMVNDRERRFITQFRQMGKEAKQAFQPIFCHEP